MSNTIKLKRGTGSDPGSSALSVGEVALRTDNGKLFTKKDDGSVVQIGGGAGAIDDGAITNAKVASDAAIAGSKISPDFGSQDITTTGHVDLPDNSKIKLGTGDDLNIFHDGSNSYIKDVGTGALRIDSDSGILFNTDSFTVNNAANSENMLFAVADGGVTLYYNSSAHFQTVSSGVNIASGNLQIGGTNVLNSSRTLYNLESIELADDKQLLLGDSGDLRIYHDGDSYIDNLTSHLYIRNNVDNDDNSNIYIQAKAGENGIIVQDDGPVNLYYDGSQRFETSSAGVQVIGNITVSGTVDGRDLATDGTKLDGIESGATSDQTASEIRFLVANASDSNVFTDALLSKLNGIASSATNVTNNNQLSNGAGYITSVSGQNYNLLSNRPTIPTNNNQLSNGAGYITSGSDRACQAWINFRGDSTVSIRDDVNFSSVSDDGTGKYTLSFSSNMSNANYCIAVGFFDNQGNANVVKIKDETQSASGFELQTGFFGGGATNTSMDFDGVFCAVFAD